MDPKNLSLNQIEKTLSDHINGFDKDYFLDRNKCISGWEIDYSFKLKDIPFAFEFETSNLGVYVVIHYIMVRNAIDYLKIKRVRFGWDKVMELHQRSNADDASG